jgi:hypothetical protein
VSSYGSQDVKRVNTDIGLGRGETDECVVEEHVKPLLIEFTLLSYQVGLTSIDYFIFVNVVL